ncbi:MAG: hypothetical protein ACLSH6_02610 [Limosilactobacillus pontis]
MNKVVKKTIVGTAALTVSHAGSLWPAGSTADSPSAVHLPRPVLQKMNQLRHTGLPTA